MLLVNVRLVTTSPSICEPRTLDNYIRSAIDQERAMNVLCPFPEDVTVPDTSINEEWRQLPMSQQEAEIQEGLTLLHNSVPKITTFISECKLELSLQNFSSKLRSMNNILKNVNTKTETHVSPKEKKRTLAVRTLQQFYTVYKKFIQGKYRALIISVCKRSQLSR